MVASIVEWFCNACEYQWLPRKTGSPSICPHCKRPFARGTIRPVAAPTAKRQNQEYVRLAREILDSDITPWADILRSVVDGARAFIPKGTK